MPLIKSIILAIALTAVGFSVVTAKDTTPVEKPAIDNKAGADKVFTVTKALDMLYNGNIPQFQAYLEGGFIDHAPYNSMPGGVESMIAFANDMRLAIPESKFTITETKVFENSVLVIGELSGAQVGPYRGSIPDSRKVTIKIIEIYDFNGNLISGRRGIRDLLPLLGLSDPSSTISSASTPSSTAIISPNPNNINNNPPQKNQSEPAGKLVKGKSKKFQKKTSPPSDAKDSEKKDK